MRKLALLAALIAAPALAQDAATQRELVQRQQQSDAFAQQLRQSQQQLQIAPGDVRRKAEVDASQLQQRQDLENVNARQLRDAAKDTPPELRPAERMKFEAERRATQGID